MLAHTTSVENSGLLAHILPQFTKETGITVHVVAREPGRRWRLPHTTMRTVLVNDPAAEAKFMADGHG